MKQIIMLISGAGTNMIGIHRACVSNKLNANIAVVISDTPDAKGLDYANAHGIRTLVINDNLAFDLLLHTILHANNPDLICLDEFDTPIGIKIIEDFKYRILNVHQSLLPKYPGQDTLTQAYESGEELYGSSIHYIIDDDDEESVVSQQSLHMQPSDTPLTMQERLRFIDPNMYVDVLRTLCIDADA